MKQQELLRSTNKAKRDVYNVKNAKPDTGKAPRTGSKPRDMPEATFEQQYAMQEGYKEVMRKVGPAVKKGFIFSDKQIATYEKRYMKLSIDVFGYVRRQLKPLKQNQTSVSCR